MNRQRQEKVEFVEGLRAELAEAKSLVLATHMGIDSNTVNELRANLRKENVQYRVVKNTLARLAIRGTDHEVISDMLAGPIALAYSTDDAISPAKVLKEFAKNHDKLVIHGGYLDGRILDLKGIEALAEMPTKEELLASLVGALEGVTRGFVVTLEAIPRQFVLTLQALHKQRSEGDAAAAE